MMELPPKGRSVMFEILVDTIRIAEMAERET